MFAKPAAACASDVRGAPAASVSKKAAPEDQDAAACQLAAITDDECKEKYDELTFGMFVAQSNLFLS